ncbi:extracellular solute-binding protein [Actinomadura barringtoniae]|uniref:Extracellular solute-binding protein n=1 Tax=Actinomadura barringtoniae TaxID=1427535 RepID=A0A939TCC4_9ACTN|nr:extracellular solute-binding protein [Actinomadura barringtoniae]MBO2451090.1 extracellular solute-binding protein [Actinomadura barringtoniae]
MPNQQPPMPGRRRGFLTRTKTHPLIALICAIAGALALLAVVGAFTFRPFYDGLPESCGGEDLTVAGGNDVSLNNQRRALVETWNQQARGDHRPARLIEVSPSSDLQYSQLKAAAESKSCAYDVFILDAPWTAEFARDGYIKELGHGDVDSPDDFFPPGLQMGAYQGRQYALPFNLDVGLLYYRSGAQPPSSPSAWPDSRYIAQLGDYEGLTVNALEYAWNHGAAGVLTGDTEPSRAALATKVYPALKAVAARIAQGGSLQTSLMRGYQEQDSIQAFARGADDGLMRHWPYAYRDLANDPKLRDGANLRFNVIAPPGANALGGQTLAISAHSRHEKDALALIQHLTSTASQQRLFSCGGFAPTRFSAFGLKPGPLRDAAVPSLPTCSQLRSAERDNANGEPDNATPQRLSDLAKAIVASLDRARPRPVTDHYETFSATFRGCARKILSGASVAPDTFAHAVQDALKGKSASC